MNAVRPLAALLAASAPAACYDTVEPEHATIDGEWQYTEVLTDELHGMTCTSTGTYTFVQQGQSFTGQYAQTGVCEDRDGNKRANPGHGPLTDGSISGRIIRFAVPPTCEYDGLADADRLTGQGFCEVTDGVSTFRFRGTWEAVR